MTSIFILGMKLTAFWYEELLIIPTSINNWHRKYLLIYKCYDITTKISNETTKDINSMNNKNTRHDTRTLLRLDQK